MGDQYALALDRFAAPFRTLASRMTLVPALGSVAARVFQAEARDQKYEMVGAHSTVPELSPEEFAACYMVVGEPIRNLAHSKGARRSVAWVVNEDSNGGIEIRLEHELDIQDSFVSSTSFECPDITRGVSADSGATVERTTRDARRLAAGSRFWARVF